MDIKKIQIKSYVCFSFIMVLFHSNVCLSADADQVVYKIEPNNKSHCVDISATLTGKASGIHFLYVPEGGISNLQFKSGSDTLPYFSTDNPHVISLKDVPYKNISLNYSYCSHNLQRDINLPIIEKDLTKFVAKQILLMPVDNTKRALLLGIDLSAYPQHFKSITSYNVNQRKFLAYTSMEEFSQSVVAIGDLKIENVKINANTVYAVSNGTWPYLEQPVSEYIRSLIKTQRDFWDDHYFPHYVVFLVKQNANYPLPRIIMGRHWNNFSVLLMPEERKKVVLPFYSLAHESFHAWIGKKMKIELPQGGLQWFHEGVNDFYGLYLAEQSKLITMKEYIKIYNFYINEYMQSPLKDVSNDTIKTNFIAGNQFDHMAQLRGHFLAKQLRDEFHQDNDNKFDLAMKALFERNQREHWPYLTEAKIDSVFKEYVGEENWRKFKDLIHSGKEIQFSPTAFYPYAKLKEVTLKAPEFGFNLRTLFYENIISEVNPKSNAYLAGLRNGHKVLGHDIDCKAYDKVVTMTINDNGSEKIIKFQPEVVKKRVPQYVMVKSPEKLHTRI